MTNANQAPLPLLSQRRWYVLRLLSGGISSTWLYLFTFTLCSITKLFLLKTIRFLQWHYYLTQHFYLCPNYVAAGK